MHRCGRLTLALASLIVNLRGAAATSQTQHVDGCPAHVKPQSAQVSNALSPETPSDVHWLRSLFTPEEATAVVRMLSLLHFNEDPYSTDHLPSYEMYLLTAGAPALNTEHLQRVRSIVLPRIHGCVLPYLRQKYDCPECMACVSLVRRYTPSERARLAAHRDALSRVTLVVELQPADGSSPSAAAAAGGLFIQNAEGAAPSFVPMKAGDAFMHDYGLLHGVHVACEACVRYSLIVWFREDGERCLAGEDVDGATQLYRHAALEGIAEGRYSWARHVFQATLDGQYHIRALALSRNATAQELTEAGSHVLEMLKAAATEQSHGNSAVFLAEIFLMGVAGVLEPDMVVAEHWRNVGRALNASELSAWEAARKDELSKAISRKQQAEMLMGGEERLTTCQDTAELTGEAKVNLPMNRAAPSITSESGQCGLSSKIANAIRHFQDTIDQRIEVLVSRAKELDPKGQDRSKRCTTYFLQHLAHQLDPKLIDELWTLTTQGDPWSVLAKMAAPTTERPQRLALRCLKVVDCADDRECGKSFLNHGSTLLTIAYKLSHPRGAENSNAKFRRAGCQEIVPFSYGDAIVWRGWDDHCFEGSATRLLIAEWTCCSIEDDTTSPVYRPDDSLASVDIALQHDNSSAILHYHKATLLRKARENLRKVLGEYQIALHLDSHQYYQQKVWLGIGEVQALRRDFHGAVDALKQLLEIDKGSAKLIATRVKALKAELTNGTPKKAMRNICLFQFDDRSDDDLGYQLPLMNMNQDLCTMDSNCLRYTVDRLGVELPAWWNKVHLVLDHMWSNMDCDSVAWLDSDAVVNGPPSTLSTQLGKFTMFISRDIPVWNDDDPFNAGAWVVRNSARGRKLMEDWLQMYPRYPAAEWNQSNGRWDCNQLDPVNGGIRSCEWGQQWFEQGTFSNHILPKYRKSIYQTSWAILNSPCVDDDEIRAAVVCHFADNLKPLMGMYMEAHGLDLKFSLRDHYSPSELKSLGKLLAALTAWKNQFWLPLQQGMQEGTLIDGLLPSEIDARRKVAIPCRDRNSELCTQEINTSECASMCEQYRVSACQALLGPHNVPTSGFFDVHTEKDLTRLDFLLLSPTSEDSMLSRHGISVVKKLMKDDSADVFLAPPDSFTHVGKYDVNKCPQASSRVMLEPNIITIVSVSNATVTFEGFVYTADRAVFSVESRYTLTLLAELLKVPGAYRISRRCGSGIGTATTSCCVVARTKQVAQLSLWPLLSSASNSTRGAHNTAFYDELQYFGPQLRECALHDNLPTMIQVEEMLVWQPLYSNNFYHFMNNGMPRLLRLLTWIQQHQDVKLFFAGSQPFATTILDALGLADRVERYSPCHIFRAKTVYVSLAAGNVLPSRSGALEMRSLFSRMIPQPNAAMTVSQHRTIIFLDRSDAEPRPLPDGSMGIPRHVQNVDQVTTELQNALAQRSIKLLRLHAAKVPLGEQFKLASSAEMLVGSHGAGLSLVIMLPKDGALLELLPGKFDMPNDLQNDSLSTKCGYTPYWYLAALRGLRYHAFLMYEFSWDDAHHVPVKLFLDAVFAMLHGFSPDDDGQTKST